MADAGQFLSRLSQGIMSGYVRRGMEVKEEKRQEKITQQKALMDRAEAIIGGKNATPEARQTAHEAWSEAMKGKVKEADLLLRGIAGGQSTVDTTQDGTLTRGSTNNTILGLPLDDPRKAGQAPSLLDLQPSTSFEVQPGQSLLRSQGGEFTHEFLEHREDQKAQREQQRKLAQLREEKEFRRAEFQKMNLPTMSPHLAKFVEEEYIQSGVPVSTSVVAYQQYENARKKGEDEDFKQKAEQLAHKMILNSAYVPTQAEMEYYPMASVIARTMEAEISLKEGEARQQAVEAMILAKYPHLAKSSGLKAAENGWKPADLSRHLNYAYKHFIDVALATKKGFLGMTDEQVPMVHAFDNVLLPFYHVLPQEYKDQVAKGAGLDSFEEWISGQREYWSKVSPENFGSGTNFEDLARIFASDNN